MKMYKHSREKYVGKKREKYVECEQTNFYLWQTEAKQCA